MKKTFSQTGRTLLETLVVVVIIAVILISVVLLYVSVRDRAQARTMSQMIMALVKERQHLNLDETKTHSRKIKGLYDIDFTLTTPLPSAPEGEYFWIGMEVDDEGLCQELIESGSIQYQMLKINNEKDGECPGNVVFYFLKNPHSKGSSSSGESQTPECPFNAICENGGYIPTGCVSGYFLQDTSCVRCPQNSIDCDGESFECLDGFYKNGNECESCGAHVATCDSTGKATSCSDNYYGENCENAPLTCLNGGTWNTTTHQCDCPNGYSGNTCGIKDPCLDINCGEHGTCSNGACVCRDNYYGDSCQTAPLTCQNGGSWNTTTHQCDCVTGYTGVLCSEKESGTCTSYKDCNEGEYCQFRKAEENEGCVRGEGSCSSKETLTPITLNLPKGNLTVYSANSANWWSASDLCQAYGLELVSMSDLGIEDQDGQSLCFFNYSYAQNETSQCVCAEDTDCIGTNEEIRNKLGTFGSFWLIDEVSSHSCYVRNLFLDGAAIAKGDRLFGSGTGTSALCRDKITYDCPAGEYSIYGLTATLPDGNVNDIHCINTLEWVCRTQGWISMGPCPPADPCLDVNCGEHGTCSNGACVCEDGWTGELCDEQEIKACTSYADCNEGEYCQFSPFDSGIEPTSGICQSVSDCGLYDIDIGNGKKYTASDYDGSCNPDWWTAKDICASLGMHMSSLSEVGCEDYKDAVCPRSGTVYGALRVEGLKYTFWTRDMWNNTMAYAITSLDDVVDRWSRATNRNILCIENGDTSGEGGTTDPCADFEPTVCRTACTNNNGTAVYTYAEEGTSCGDIEHACDGKGNCNECLGGSLSLEYILNNDNYVKGDLANSNGCYCFGNSVNFTSPTMWNGSFCTYSGGAP